MEPEQVRSRVAVAVGLKLGVPNDKARIVGDAVLRVIQECGLITISAGDLARVNELVRVGTQINAGLIESLLQIRALGEVAGQHDAADLLAQAMTIARLATTPDAIVIEGEFTKPVADA